MNGDYLAGSLALVLIVGPWLVGAPRLARRLLPKWRGTRLALAAAVLGVSGIIVVAELCGVLAGFSRWTVAIANAAVGVTAAAAGSGGSKGHPPPSIPEGMARRISLGGVALCVLALTATFLARDAKSLQTGPTDADSLHYHLSIAADFVQTHSLDHLHQTAASDASVYYPYDAELLQAVGMLGPHPDIAVFGLNLLFGWLALLACWVIGGRWGMAEPATAAGAALLAVPLVAGGSSGPGLNDIPTIAAFLSGVALLVTAGVPRADRPRGRWAAELAVAGLALGVAAGSKISTLAPVGLVAIGGLLRAKGDRRLYTAAIAACAVLTGGFWYFRDWALANSPLPSINLTIAGHGFHQVPYPEVKPYDFTVAHYLTHWQVVQHYYIPGLHASWSVAWPVVGLVLVAGVVLTLVRDRDLTRRMLAIVVVLGFIAYIVTPTTALGPKDQPVLFAANSRYALPIMALAIVLFATNELFRRYAVWIVVLFTGLVLVELGDRFFGFKLSYTRGIAATAVLVLAALVLAYLWSRHGRGVVTAAVTIATIGLIAVGLPVQHRYLRDRYAGGDSTDQIFHGIGLLTGQRVEVASHGTQYPFYGPSFANRVDYLGVTAPDQSYNAPRTCVATRQALASDHATVLVVEPYAQQPNNPEQPALIRSWAESIPGAHVAARNDFATVILLPSEITSAGC